MQHVTIHNPDDFIDFDEFVRGVHHVKIYTEQYYTEKEKLIIEVYKFQKSMDFYKSIKSNLVGGMFQDFKKKHKLNSRFFQQLTYDINLGRYDFLLKRYKESMLISNPK